MLVVARLGSGRGDVFLFLGVVLTLWDQRRILDEVKYLVYFTSLSNFIWKLYKRLWLKFYLRNQKTRKSQARASDSNLQ